MAPSTAPVPLAPPPTAATRFANAGNIEVKATADRLLTADAEALFIEGNKLMSEHKLDQACNAFEGSNLADPRAGTLIRLGECREQNQQLASAWSAYRDALNRVKDPRKRDYAAARASMIEPRLSYLTVVVDPKYKLVGFTVMRNGIRLDPMLWNHALPADGGDYAIAARAPGYVDWQATASVAVEGANVRIEVPALSAIVSLSPPPRR